MVAKLFLFRLFGQRPRRGRSPVEHRGTFICPFVRPCAPPLKALSGLKSALSGLESALSGLKFVLSDLLPILSGLKSALPGHESERADFRPERADSSLRGQISGLKGQILGLRGQIQGLIGQISGLRGPGGTNEWTDKRTKVPCDLQDFVPFGAVAQKRPDTRPISSRLRVVRGSKANGQGPCLGGGVVIWLGIGCHHICRFRVI